MPSKLSGLRTVAGRVRALTALAAVALTVLFTVLTVGAGDAREGLDAVGHREGPMVVATADMYLALSDMDAQVTGVLLAGGEEGWLCDPGAEGSDCERGSPRYVYDIRREDAQRAALEAARLTRGDPVRGQTVQSVLDGLHAYDQQVQAAMEAGRREGRPAVALGRDAVQKYRAANALMTGNLLPKAYNLTLDGTADVDAAYREKHAAVEAGWLRVVGAGLALMAALGALQIFLARRFRRLLSVPLAAALAGTLALTVSGASLLATEADHMRAVKTAGFDPVLQLTRARAIAQGLHTDRGRLLLDPADTDRYDQMYLEKSQKLLYIPGATRPETYIDELGSRLGTDERGPDVGGLFGSRNGAWVDWDAEGGRDELLKGYHTYQTTAWMIPTVAEDGAQRGLRAHMEPRWPYLPNVYFRHLDEDFDARISHHEFLKGRAVAGGDRALEPWTWLPAAATLAIAALIVAGVWPRLSEYR
ncbi:hypothetical protein [Actinomadura sp. 7K507]|uniref:hypothetical protein n=1 Tax=Actinomadura sp. 7K507 TaxID=2530365 RepID=UPI00104E8D0E|nr:hypothetical protein [Actinomadura sp. 7K507]TDC79363.1 hypothetical protein E1285_36200 [Actinomadura sp. 7K507]